MEARMKSSGTQNHEKPATRAPHKNTKKKTTKSQTRSPFWCQKRNSVSRLFGALFEALAALGPNWSPSLPREPPGWSQTLLLMIFRSFWMDLRLLFALAHLSAITFFAIVLGFLLGCFLSSPTCLPPTSKIKSTVAGSARSALRSIRSRFVLYA